MGLNVITVDGKVKKVETKDIGDKKLMTFDLCNVTGYGERVNFNWFKVKYWREMPLTDDTHVAVTGRVEQRSYETNGETKHIWELTANEIVYLEKK